MSPTPTQGPVPASSPEPVQPGLGDFTWEALAAFINLGATIILLIITGISVSAAVNAAKSSKKSADATRDAVEIAAANAPIEFGGTSMQFPIYSDKWQLAVELENHGSTVWIHGLCFVIGWTKSRNHKPTVVMPEGVMKEMQVGGLGVGIDSLPAQIHRGEVVTFQSGTTGKLFEELNSEYGFDWNATRSVDFRVEYSLLERGDHRYKSITLDLELWKGWDGYREE